MPPVSPPEEPAAEQTDGPVYRRALFAAVLGVGAVGLSIVVGDRPEVKIDALTRLSVPEETDFRTRGPKLQAVTLSDEQRDKGLSECTPLDPIGLGPYMPYRNVRFGGRLLVPQKGGHTDDGGYDVIVHFHGHEALRKTLVQVARGVVFVGFDKGVGSGPYSKPFLNPDLWPKVRASIDAGLKAASGDDRAHIRRLALSAWSAGYGAVNRIVERAADDVDAVVLLDGLHAAWDPAKKRGPTHESAMSMAIQPVFDFAKRALDGEKIFVFSHSTIDPVDYPSTRQTADLLLHQLGLERTPLSDRGERFRRTATVDEKGLHVWSHDGDDQAAHCDHIRHIAEVVRDILEPAWGTPAMDRSVESTPAPKLGTVKKEPALEFVTDDGAEVPRIDEFPDVPLERQKSKPPTVPEVDRGGLEPMPVSG